MLNIFVLPYSFEIVIKYTLYSVYKLYVLVLYIGIGSIINRTAVVSAHVRLFALPGCANAHFSSNHNSELRHRVFRSRFVCFLPSRKSRRLSLPCSRLYSL